ncbi:MAG: NADH:ubiquinone reductase (Na(+)-transporting) subunit C, partial [Bacteroidetes bacterium]|nr:NADH:ubiquinone reductase (Na(+)-transporting) subunit C [Bacteroidota bacterium]
MQTNSNSYTIMYAAIMTIIVAVLLAGLTTGLKPMQSKNYTLDKKMTILQAVDKGITKEQAETAYNSYITEVVVDGEGKEQSGVQAFDLDLKKQYAEAPANQRLPLYIYKKDGKELYIVPMVGNGLWDAIGGYVALEKDMSTIEGTVFTHVGETPGLGAEITTDWFQKQFLGKKIMDGNNFQSVHVIKGKSPDTPNNPHQVDGITGATITGNG